MAVARVRNSDGADRGTSLVNSHWQSLANYGHLLCGMLGLGHFHPAERPIQQRFLPRLAGIPRTVAMRYNLSVFNLLKPFSVLE